MAVNPEVSRSTAIRERDSGGAQPYVAPGDSAKAIEFFEGRGWSKAQATGIVANLIKESGLHPEPSGPNDGGKAYGAGQWHPPRQAAFRAVFGKDMRGSPLMDQLVFADWELRNTEKKAGIALSLAKTPGEAAAVVSKLYLRPKDKEGEAAKRADIAESIASGGKVVKSAQSQALEGKKAEAQAAKDADPTSRMTIDQMYEAMGRAHAAGVDENGLREMAKIIRERLNQEEARPKDEPPTKLERVGTGAKDALVGGVQYVANKFPETYQAIQRGLGREPPSADQINAAVADRERRYQESRGPDANKFDAWRVAGNVAATLPVDVAAGAALGPIGGALAGGGIAGAMQPVTSGDYNQEKRGQIGTSMALGGVLAGAGRIVSGALHPGVQEGAKELIDRGVTPTVGKLFGGIPAAVESRATSMPIIGDMIRAADQRSIASLNRVVADDAASVIGAKTTAAVGREAVDQVYRAYQGAYNALTPRLVMKDGPVLQRALSAARNANWAKLNGDQEKAVLGAIDDIMTRFRKGNGVITGDVVKAIDVDLGKRIAGETDVILQNALGRVQDAFRLARNRMNPAVGPQLSKVDQGYALYKMLEDAVARSADGIATPRQIAAASRKTSGRGKYARGQGRMQEIADDAVRIIGNAYPDSGTAGRIAQIAVPSAIGAGLATNPVPTAAIVGTALAGAKAIYGETGARLIAKALTAGRGETTKGARKMVEASIPATIAPSRGAVAEEKRNQKRR